MAVMKAEEYVSDTYLTELFWERKSEAVEKADKKYHELLFSAIVCILKNDKDAEECLDDVYIKIWESIPPNRPSSFRAYALKIARNTAMSIFRASNAQKRAHKWKTVSFDNLSSVLFENDNGELENSQKIREIINRYLNSIDERKMYIFMSRYYFNKPIGEIAKKLHCSQSTVNKEIKKIKIELREKLEEGGIYV